MVTISAPPAPTIKISSGDGQAARPGAAVRLAPAVLVTKADGSPWAGVVVTFAVAGGGGAVAGPTQTTGANGIATVGSWTLGAALGPNTLTATAAAAGVYGNPVSFSALGMDMQTMSGGAGNHSCGIAIDNRTYCWGQNNWGQLGDGTAIDRYQPTPIVDDPTVASLAAGMFATCGLSPKGQAYCWGSGAYLSYPWRPTPVGGALRFTTLSPGTFSVCGVATDGAGYCWGANYNGQLGDGSKTTRPTPTPVAGGLQFINLVVGDKHGCGVTTAGEAYCWGTNQYGALGDGTTTDHLLPAPVATTERFTRLSLGNYYTCGLTTSGEAYCWGAGGLGNGTGGVELRPTKVVGGHTFTALITGAGHTCGLTPSGAAYCWGAASKGQLGIGPTVSNSIDTPVPVSGGFLFQELAAGWEHTCGLTSGGTAYCWGDNDNGQLGDGTTTTRWVPTGVIGGLQFLVAGP
jgi:alpha-tubulin suppressor-like RCC1 family protein